MLDARSDCEWMRCSMMKVVLLGVCLFVCPPLFAQLGQRWFPAEYGAGASDHLQRARILRRRFWGALAGIVLVVALVLLLRWWHLGAFPLDEAKDWWQLAAAVLALLAALGRGGWAIQSFKRRDGGRAHRQRNVPGRATWSSGVADSGAHVLRERSVALVVDGHGERCGLECRCARHRLDCRLRPAIRQAVGEAAEVGSVSRAAPISWRRASKAASRAAASPSST